MKLNEKNNHARQIQKENKEAEESCSEKDIQKIADFFSILIQVDERKKSKGKV